MIFFFGARPLLWGGGAREVKKTPRPAPLFIYTDEKVGVVVVVVVVVIVVIVGLCVVLCSSPSPPPAANKLKKEKIMIMGFRV